MKWMGLGKRGGKYWKGKRCESAVAWQTIKISGDYNLQQVLKTTALVCHPIFSVSYIHLLPLLEQKGHKSKKVFQHILRCNTTSRVYRLKFWFEGLKIHHLSITTCFLFSSVHLDQHLMQHGTTEAAGTTKTATSRPH